MLVISIYIKKETISNQKSTPTSKKKKINLVLVEGNNKMRTEVNKATKSIQTEPN